MTNNVSPHRFSISRSNCTVFPFLPFQLPFQDFTTIAMVHGNNLARAAIALASTALAAPAPRDSYNFVLHPDHPLALAKRNASLMKRQNYVQDYTTGGDVQFSHAGDYFSLSFDTTEDFVVGIGWNPGSTAPITHQGSFSVAQGLGTLSVYGWSTNPLVEYYVIEDSSGFAQTGTEMGTLESDGSSYVSVTPR